MPQNTSWNEVADWYDKHLAQPDTYHREVIIPKLTQLVKRRVPKGAKVLDLGCGQGLITRELAKLGYEMTGTDLAPELIKLARQNSPKSIRFMTGDARNLASFKDGEFSAVASVLVWQNIDDIARTVSECKRVLQPGGEVFLVINHPMFRIPKHTDWGWDEAKQIQFRRVDRYLSEVKIPITAHPGKKDSPVTPSFHRPLQSYFKALRQQGFVVVDLQEWVSHKKSEASNKRAKAENLSRAEIPMFMCLVAKRGEAV